MSIDFDALVASAKKAKARENQTYTVYAVDPGIIYRDKPTVKLGYCQSNRLEDRNPMLGSETRSRSGHRNPPCGYP